MAICSKCHSECVIDLEPDDFDEATSSTAGGTSSVVPDDLQLECGDHFHWQCLLDEASSVAISGACPFCHRIITSTPSESSGASVLCDTILAPLQVLSRYINEGGIQDHLDILPIIEEEAYLDVHPNCRPARAFMTMCAEGDVGGVMELISLEDEEDDKELEGLMTSANILRYQDPLARMKSALHVAIENSQEEIVWLLLWLASSLDLSLFPNEVVQAAQGLDARRQTAAAGADIRSLRDEQGRTADDLARSLGGSQSLFSQMGVLRM